MKLCTVEGCASKHLARGYCSMHWARWRKWGTPHGRQRYDVCRVDGCSLPPRSGYAEWCETHYYRLRRTGSADDPVRISGGCSITGCDHPAERLDGLCRMHHLRIKAHGDPSRGMASGDRHPWWTGDNATYTGAHQRHRKDLGPARAHACVDCGGTAAHWSYNHSDPDELRSDDERPYSVHSKFYEPRCVRCHKRFDMARVMRERGEVRDAP